MVLVELDLGGTALGQGQMVAVANDRAAVAVVGLEGTVATELCVQQDDKIVGWVLVRESSASARVRSCVRVCEWECLCVC